MIEYVIASMMFCTAVICLIAVLSKHFEDNFFQRIGLAILCIAEFIRSAQMFQGADVVLLFQWIHFAIFSFAFGTYWKFILRVWFAKHYPRVNFHFPYDRRKENDISTHL